MAPSVLFRLLKQHLVWFILIPAIAAGIVFYLTRNEPRLYKSQAMLYTGLSSGYSLVPGQQNVMDRSAVSFDNLLTTLNSPETERQIGVSLLTEHLQLPAPDPLQLAAPGFDQLQRAIPADLRMDLLNGPSAEHLRQAVDSLSQTKGDNPIKALFEQPSSYYSPQGIGKKLKATRKNTNDMLELEYDANDPAVAQKTLEYAIDILGKRYTSLKTSETSSVVGYYNDKSHQTKQRLEKAEQNLQSFSVENKVVDFDEDAKNVVDTREQIIADYNAELMRNRAAKASMDALHERMGQRSTQLNATDALKTKQDELTEAQRVLVNARAYNRSSTAVAQQQAKVDRLMEELKTTAAKYNSATNSSESVSQQTLANEWLARVTAYEESSARLKLFDNRLKETASKTAVFSPLSSKRRKLDRELSVAEKEYLASTENLNQARTQQGDVTKGGVLSTLDKPNYPLSPLPSKRWLLIGASIGVGLFLTLFLVAIRFWLDQRVNSPEKAELVIGRPVAAMFPTVRKAAGNSKMGRAALNMFEQLCNAINIEIVQKTAKPHPPIITVFSVRSQQGKTWTINGLANLYADAGQQVAYFYPRFNDKAQVTEQNGITFIPYTVRPDFMNVLKLEHLLDDDAFVAAHFDKVVLELPSLVSTAIPVYLVDKSYVSVLVVDTSSPWARTEKQLLEMYMRVATHPVLTVLNRVEDDYVKAFGRHETGYQLKRSTATLASQRNLPLG